MQRKGEGEMHQRIIRRDKSSASTWRKAVRRGLSRMGVSGRNQRRFTRFDCMFPVEIHLDTPGQVSVINAVAQNISSGGMLLKCSALLDFLTPCHLSFRIPEWFPGASRTCEVMTYAHVRHADPSGQYIGVAFNAPI